jgi:hypothetical protein
VKKKSKVKSIDLPITSKVANLSQDQLNNYLEREVGYLRLDKALTLFHFWCAGCDRVVMVNDLGV